MTPQLLRENPAIRPSETKITIKNLQELAEQLDVNNLPVGLQEIQEPLKVSQADLEELKNKIRDQQDEVVLKKIESFLKERTDIISDTKSIMDAFRTREQQEQQERKDKEPDLESGIKKALLEVSNQLPHKGTGEKIAQQIEDTGNSGLLGFFGKIDVLWKKIFNFFSGLFLSFGAFVKGIFSPGAKAKEIAEKIKEKLNPEQLKIIRENINSKAIEYIDTANTKFNSRGNSPYPIPLITEQEKENLQTLLKKPNTFTEIEMESINEKIKNGEFNSILDLQGIISSEKYNEIMSCIFTEERKTKIEILLKEELKAEIIQRYGIELEMNEENTKKLNLLIDKYLKFENSKEISKNIVAHKWVTVGDGLGALFEIIKNGALFILELFTNGIVGGTDLVISLGKNTMEIASIKLAGMGIDLPITQKVLDKMQTLTDEQRNILFGAMLREGGFVFQAMSQATYYLSRQMVEAMMPTEGSGLGLAKQSMFNQYQKQINSFNTIGKLLGMGSVTKEISSLMSTLQERFKNIQEINEILAVRKNADGDVNKFKENLKNIQTNNTVAKEVYEKVKNTTKFSDITDELIKKVNLTTTFLSQYGFERLSQSANILKKGIYSQYLKEAFKVEHHLHNIASNQIRVLTGGINKIMGIFPKISSIFSSYRLETDVQNLRIEVNAKTFPSTVASLKQIAKECPGFLGSLVQSGLPLTIIINDFVDETKDIEDTLNDLSYLAPIVGPMRVLTNVGTRLTDNKELEYKNLALASSMSMFLIADVGTILTLVPTQGWMAAGGYLINPITAPINAVAKTFVMTRLGIDAVKAGQGKEAMKLMGKGTKDMALNFIKSITNGGSGYLKLAGLASLGIYVGFEYFDETTIEKFTEKGYITPRNGGAFDIDIEKIQEEITEEEKQILLNEVILMNIKALEGVEVEVLKNSIIIKTDTNKNKNLEYLTALYLQDYFPILKMVYGIDSKDIKIENSN